MTDQLRIIDTHTGGEPTRIVFDGAPDLGIGSLVDRRDRFRREYDHYRSAIVNEPRGSDVMVGALLTEPTDPTCCAGVIFFNNVGYLGMCGHGTMGVAVALGRLNRISAGTHRLDTPVGIVTFSYDGQSRVSLENVPSYRYRNDVAIKETGMGNVIGDIAWGGNWFFLVKEALNPIVEDEANPKIEYELLMQHAKYAATLTQLTQLLRQQLEENGITGEHGAVIDHIELYAPPGDPNNHSRNFVLCPGGAYDRSPCGTGTSAKIACLAADGKLQPGEIWRQESILGSVFESSYRWADDHSAVIPTITGTAYVNGESTLLFDPDDPFAWGNVEFLLIAHQPAAQARDFLIDSAKQYPLLALRAGELNALKFTR